MKKMVLGVVLIISIAARAQDSTTPQPPVDSSIHFSGFVETYYSFDFNRPADNNRPWFIYSHNRHNEFTVNLAYVKGSYNKERVRANIALAAGTYMNANYAAEPGVLKNVFEANVGKKILKSKSLWLEAGIFSSHIGFESAHSPSCLILTRSILADNSPYYESGAKITYITDSGKWLLSLLALNGWQRIRRVDGNSLLSWGTQITFTPSSRTSINYSTFLGTDKPDSARQLRLFHNLYGIIHLTSKLELILGFDLGHEQAKKASSKYNLWYGTTGILHYAFTNSWATAVRGEYYSDEKGVIINTGSVNGFKTVGFSVNIDRRINDYFFWRTELRTFRSMDAVFVKDGQDQKNNTAITSSLAITF